MLVATSASSLSGACPGGMRRMSWMSRKCSWAAWDRGARWYARDRAQHALPTQCQTQDSRAVTHDLQRLPAIAFLGAGQMAEAFVRGLLRAALLEPNEVWLSDIREGRAEQLSRELGVNAARDNLEAVGHAELILLSVKPQDVPAVLEEVGADVRTDH